MNKSDIEALSNLLDKKILILENYDGITQRLLVDDINELDSVFNVRKGILDDYIKLNSEIESFVLKQSVSIQEKLKAMSRCVGLDEVNGDFIVIREKFNKIKKTVDTIKSKDKEIGKRFNSYRQELIDGMLNLNKSKRVIDYMDSMTKSELFNGKAFDEKQ